MNIVKHAQAKSVLIRVTVEDDQLSVIVRDDGVGIDDAIRDAAVARIARNEASRRGA